MYGLDAGALYPGGAYPGAPSEGPSEGPQRPKSFYRSHVGDVVLGNLRRHASIGMLRGTRPVTTKPGKAALIGRAVEREAAAMEAIELNSSGVHHAMGLDVAHGGPGTVKSGRHSHGRTHWSKRGGRITQSPETSKEHKRLQFVLGELKSIRDAAATLRAADGGSRRHSAKGESSTSAGSSREEQLALTNGTSFLDEQAMLADAPSTAFMQQQAEFSARAPPPVKHSRSPPPPLQIRRTLSSDS